jgi:hypothetical protein
MNNNNPPASIAPSANTNTVPEPCNESPKETPAPTSMIPVTTVKPSNSYQGAVSELTKHTDFRSTCSSQELPDPATLDSKFAQTNPDELRELFVDYLRKNPDFAKDVMKVAGQDNREVSSVEPSSDISPSADVESRKVGGAASCRYSSCLSSTRSQSTCDESGRGAASIGTVSRNSCFLGASDERASVDSGSWSFIEGGPSATAAAVFPVLSEKKRCPLLPDDFVSYLKLGDVDIEEARKKLHLAPIVLGLGKDVIEKEPIKYLHQLKDRMNSIRSYTTSFVERQILTDLNVALYRENIPSCQVDDYQESTNYCSQIIFQSHNQILDDGSTVKVTFEDDATLLRFLNIRNSFSIKSIKVKLAEGIERSFNVRVNTDSQNNFAFKVVDQVSKMLRRKFDRACHNSICQHFTTKDGNSLPKELLAKWPNFTKKARVIKMMGKEIRGTLWICTASEEIDDVDASLELEKVSLVFINMNTNSVTLTTVIISI